MLVDIIVFENTPSLHVPMYTFQSFHLVIHMQGGIKRSWELVTKAITEN